MQDYEPSSTNHDPDDKVPLEPKQESPPKPPGKIGVYDRPEGVSSRSIFVMVVALILVLLVAFVVFQYVL